MLERLAVAAIALAAVMLAIAAGRAWYARRNARIEARLREAAPAATDQASLPRIVYFTTTTCVVCKAQQEPAIAAVLRHAGEVTVERHDAVAERELADEYGVLTVPTTAVYGGNGQLVAVNRGFAPAALLLAQVRGQEPVFEGGAVMSSESLN